MNTHIAIYSCGANNLGYPATFPVRCYEFASLEEAQAAHPDALIMAISDYPAYHADQLSQVTNPDPWWKFWAPNPTLPFLE